MKLRHEDSGKVCVSGYLGSCKSEDPEQNRVTRGRLSIHLQCSPKILQLHQKTLLIRQQQIEFPVRTASEDQPQGTKNETSKSEATKEHQLQKMYKKGNKQDSLGSS